ncbi:hypothetical protein VNI00_005484 [Paramarasmius palmivorus]|uniref:Uncharacterized protein n=1 Tax=Paramarasmius palmivorus TaxID=297713 RepID=A0AAW0DFW1_9AGAR
MPLMRDSFIPNRGLFPSTNAALKALSNLGKPPKIPDISNPSTQCWSALDALAFLTFHNLTTWDEGTYFKNVVLKHWPTSIADWYRCFLEQFVLTEEEPTTERGLVFRDKIVSVLPILPTYGSDPHGRSKRTCSILLTSQGRFLISSMMKTWLKLTEFHHPAASGWTTLILSALLSRDEMLIEEIQEGINSATGRDVVGIVIRELLRLAYSCRASSFESDILERFDLFVLIMYPCLYPSTPLHLSFLARGGVAALVKALSGLLSPPALAHHHSNPRSSGTGITIVKTCFGLLQRCLDYPSNAAEALHAGLLKVVIKATPYYNDGKGADGNQCEQNLGDVIGDVIVRVSRLLVYPSVARRFKKSKGKYVTSEWENSLEKTHKYFADIWRSCLDNVAHVEIIRSVLKEPEKTSPSVSKSLRSLNRTSRRMRTYPVLVLDFDDVEPDLDSGHELMDPSRFDILDRNDVFEDKRLLATDRERMIEYISNSGHEASSKLVVVAFFPGLWPLSAWSVVTVVGIPRSVAPLEQTEA